MRGTHNEKSTLLLTKLMKENGFNKNDERFYFSQLLGMSDHISYNLSKNGYNVAKYVPYGPVKEVIPYLVRRGKLRKTHQFLDKWVENYLTS